MAFCANCGAKVGDNDKFCASCGAARVPGAPAAQPSPPPPPVSTAPAGEYQGAQPGAQPVGGSQPNAGTAGDSSTGLKANIAGLLCYLFGWVTGIIFLVLEKKSQFVRFHAAQSIVVFGFFTVLNILLAIIFTQLWFLGTFLNVIIGLAAFLLWLFLMYKAYQGEAYKLPIAGDIAQGIAGKM